MLNIPPNYTLTFIILSKRSRQGHTESTVEKRVWLFSPVCLSEPYKWEWERRVCLMRSERGGGHAEPTRGNLVFPVNRDYYLLCVGSILGARVLNHSILLERSCGKVTSFCSLMNWQFKSVRAGWIGLDVTLLILTVSSRKSKIPATTKNV